MSLLQAKVDVLHFYADLKKDKNASIFKISPVNRDILVLNCEIPGPSGTIWEGGKFTLQLNFSKDFPANPPELKFISPIFHPNVSQDGKVCLDVLKPANWGPQVTFAAILFSVQDLLANPNAESPLNNEASGAYIRYKNNSDEEYVNRVKQCVRDSTSSQNNQQNNQQNRSMNSQSGFGVPGLSSGFSGSSLGSGFGTNTSLNSKFMFDFSLPSSGTSNNGTGSKFSLPNSGSSNNAPGFNFSLPNSGSQSSTPASSFSFNFSGLNSTNSSDPNKSNSMFQTSKPKDTDSNNNNKSFFSFDFRKIQSNPSSNNNPSPTASNLLPTGLNIGSFGSSNLPPPNLNTSSFGSATSNSSTFNFGNFTLTANNQPQPSGFSFNFGTSVDFHGSTPNKF